MLDDNTIHLFLFRQSLKIKTNLCSCYLGNVENIQQLVTN